MTRDQLTECMHAVLDGTATQEQSMLLGAVLASDAEAAEEFASWKALFAGLAAMPPAHPPEGLVAAIAAALPDHAAPSDQIVVAGVQLPARPSVVAGGQGHTTRLPPIHPAIFHRATNPDSPKEHRHMNVKRKVWAGGAIVVVALGVAILVSGYPPKEENVLGTVVPAERYRAPQAGAEAVKLGEPAAATPTAGSERAAIQAGATEAQARAQASEAKVTAEGSASKMAAQNTEAKAVAEGANAKIVAQGAEAKAVAEGANAKIVAQGAEAKAIAQGTNAKMIAQGAEAKATAQGAEARMNAQKADARMQAQKADASMQAQKVDAGMQSQRSNQN